MLESQQVSFATFLSVDFGDSVGSGFRILYQGKSYIVTAKHVIYNREKRLSDLYIKSQNVYGTAQDAYSASVELTEDHVFTFGQSDIALIEMDVKYNLHVESLGQGIVAASIGDIGMFNNVRLAQNILTVGFPSSLTIDSFYDIDRPLLRTGIVAGINLNNKTFVIDSMAFYGVSGAPVILVSPDTGISIVGIVSRYVPFITEWRNKHERSFSRTDFYNSGYAVCEPLDDLVRKIAQ